MQAHQKRQISLIQQVKNPQVVENPTISELLHAIRTGKALLDQYSFVGTVKKIRSLLESGQPKDAVIKNLKITLPKVFPHINIERNRRVGECDGIFSGYVHYDIDAIRPEDLSSVEETLQSLNPICYFKSPSNLGYKIFFLTDLNGSTKDKDHLFKGVWQAIGDKVNEALSRVSAEYQIDNSQKAITSGFFVSYDPDLWESPNPSIVKIEDLNLDLTQETKTSSKASKASKASKGSPASKRHVKIEKIGKGNYPEKEEILEHIKWMHQTKQETAINAVIEYLATPKMEGKRYNAFFKMASIVCNLGRSNDNQEWSVEQFERLLDILDYDGSRRENNQIEGTMDSLKKYGYFENKPSQSKKNDSIYTQHLTHFATPDLVLQAKKMVSECHQVLLNEILSNKIVALDASTGSGKTTWIFKDLINDYEEGRILVTVPLRNLLSQLQAKWKHDDRIQFLYDGGRIDPSAKVIVCTYEKLLSHQKEIKAGDLLVVDEGHLMSGAFRSATNQKLINLIQKGNKCLLLSATQQALVTILKTYIDIRYVKIQTETKASKIDIKITDAKDIVDWSIHHIVEILKQNPNERILCFKNDKSMLLDIQTQLSKQGISSLVVTRETTKTDIDVQGLWAGKIPTQSVILSTQVSELGVELKFINRTIIIGKQYSSEQIVQIANRTRSLDATIEWLLPKVRKQQLFDFTECFSADYLSQYKEEAKTWVDIEKMRFNVLFPKGEIKKIGLDTDYVKALDNTLLGSKEGVNRLKGIIQVVNVEGKSKIDLDIQGFAQNVCAIERQNETEIEYVRKKLLKLWGIETEVSYCKSTLPKAPKGKIQVNIWLILKTCIVFKDNLFEEIEEVLLKHNINQLLISDILKQIEVRTDKLKEYGLSVDEYLFVSDSEFDRIIDLALIHYNPVSLHPIEQALAQTIKDQDLVGKVIYQDQIVQIIDNLSIMPEAQHIHDVVKSFSQYGKSRWFRKLVMGQSTRRLNPSTGKKERCLEISGIAWENLKVEQRVGWSLHPNEYIS